MLLHEQCIQKILEDKDLINQVSHGGYIITFIDGKVVLGEINIKRKPKKRPESTSKPKKQEFTHEKYLEFVAELKSEGETDIISEDQWRKELEEEFDK